MITFFRSALIRLVWIPATFLVAQEDYPTLPNKEFQATLDQFIDSFSGKEEAETKVRNFALLNSILGLHEKGATDQLLVSFFLIEDMEEYFLKKEIWKTVAAVKRSECAFSASRFLALVDPRYASGIMEIMAYVDAAKGSQACDFSRYVSVLKVNKKEPIERLIIYMFKMSPEGALRALLEVYGEELEPDERTAILAGVQEVSALTREHSIALKGLRSAVWIREFLMDLKDYNNWYLDLYIAVSLRKMAIDNFSPELNEYFRSKPDSLANRFRESGQGRGVLAHFPPREIILPERSKFADERGEILAESRAERTSRVKKDVSDSVDAKSKQVEPEETLIEEDPPQWPYVLLAGAILGIALLLHRAWRRNRGSN